MWWQHKTNIQEGFPRRNNGWFLWSTSFVVVNFRSSACVRTLHKKWRWTIRKWHLQVSFHRLTSPKHSVSGELFHWLLSLLFCPFLHWSPYAFCRRKFMSTLYIVQSQVWPCWPNKTSFGQICERIILDDHRSLSIRWCTWSCSPEPKVYRARWRYGHTFSLSWRFSFRTTLVRERKATCSKWKAEKTSEKLFPLVTPFYAYDSYIYICLSGIVFVLHK